MTRNIPKSVRRTLRQEVGFCCPFEDCGSPFLEYHHFDPEFHVEKHHRPEGMIALCPTHHARARELSKEQLKLLKRHRPTSPVAERFRWMRHEIVAIVGGNYYHEVPSIVQVCGQNLIWFERDVDGHLLLSFDMLREPGLPITSMRQNDWIVEGEPMDIECGPRSSKLEVKYENGDALTLAFEEWEQCSVMESSHPPMQWLRSKVSYPLLSVTITMRVNHVSFLGTAGTDVGGCQITGSVFTEEPVGLAIT